MGTSKINAGDNPAMDEHIIQGGRVEILHLEALNAAETGIGSSYIHVRHFA